MGALLQQYCARPLAAPVTCHAPCSLLLRCAAPVRQVTLVAVGETYQTWEGYKDAATGETKIGISYAKLCQ